VCEEEKLGVWEIFSFDEWWSESWREKMERRKHWRLYIDGRWVRLNSNSDSLQRSFNLILACSAIEPGAPLRQPYQTRKYYQACSSEANGDLEEHLEYAVVG
jgi:hypothetical protein